MQTPKKYKVRSGTIDSGKPYEIKTVVLLSLKCCLEDLEHFWIASNVNECGALDDIILFRKEKNKKGITHLTQLKHQDAAKNITKDQILAAEGNFSIKKYLESCIKLSSAISNQNTKKSDIIDHLRNNLEMVYILYTNKDVAGQFEFLEPVNSCSDFLNVNGNVYGFKPNKFNIFTTPNDPKEAFLRKIFLYTKQPHINEIDSEIKSVLKKLIGSVKKSDKDLVEIIRKFELFIEEWSKGSLNGHYPLTKTLILKKITEILLEPFMVKFTGHIVIQEGKEDEEKYNVWNEMIEDNNLIVINQSDKVTNEFMERFVCSFTVKHEESVKNCTTIKRDLLRVPGNTQAFCEIYEYLWKTHKIPLVIQVDSESEIEEVREILKMSQETFRITILNKSKTVIAHLKSSKMISIVSDLKKEQQKKLFSLPIKLQGRHLNGIEKFDLKEIFDLKVKDIIYILCHRFNIGGEFEVLPDVFVDISLKRVWLKQLVLQEAIDDVFLIHCKFMEEFKQFIQGDSLDIDDSEMIEWKNIDSFNSDCHRIVLYENANDLKAIECYFKKHKGKPIHFLISHRNSKIEWVKSWGTIKNLKDFRISEKFEEKRVMASEAIERFCKEMKSIIISSNPGMGKSVFIHYFARDAPVDFWVVKINLAKYKAIYKNFINESECDINLNSFFEQILEERCSKENLFLAKAVFRNFFKSKNIIVLLDGFDEIPIKYQNDAKQFIKFLSKSGYFVLITTRPVLKNDLESLLDTFSLNLNLFIREDQEYFLENYFSKFAEVVCEKETTILYVEFLLNAAKNNLNDRDNEFTGVPLQTLLLAEVFIDDFKTFLVTKKFINKHFDLLYLYENFIEKKIRIACEKFGDISEDMIHEYKICRTFYALRLLFSEEDLKQLEIDVKLEHGKTLFPHMLELVQKDGIVVAETETNIVFIHQTFAEYLAAEWLAENVKNEHKDIAKNLLKVTFDTNLKVVRNIFDRVLAKNCPLHLAIINFQIDKVANLINSNHFEDLDDGNRNFLHILASWGLHHTMKRIESELFELRKMLHEDEMIEILKLIPDEKLNNSRDQILEYTPIDYAIISSSLCIADILCERMKSSRIYIDLEDDENLVLLYCYKMNYFSLSRKIINHTSIDSKLFVNKEDRDSLSFIISKGNIKKLNLLISEGINLNEKDKFGSAPIHIAVRLEKEEMVKILINNGVDINVTDSTGKTPLHWSVLQGLLNVVKLLIANETDVNIVDNQGRTALHYAIISYPQHQLQIIYELSKANLEILDVNDMTPFLWAAHYGYTECVNLFLELGVDIEQKNTKEITALLWAAANGHIATVDLLFSKGANVNAKTENDTTPLIFAARYGYTNVVNFLLDKGADIESMDHDGMSALCWAAHGGHYNIASLLINRQAEIITETGISALCAASRHGHKDVVELFLSHGANIESEDDERRTSLHWAAANGHKDIVKLFLSKGANVNAQDKYGNNALYKATLHGFTQVVKLLLSKGSEIPKNCLHIAADRGHSDLISVFLLKGMDVNLKDEDGMTPLHYAARIGSKKSVALLLIKGADIEAKNYENQTPLILAVKEGCKEVTNLLLTEGANIEARTNKNETPLIVSARYNRNKEITSLLLSEGARIKSKDDEGRLAFHWAAYNPYMLQDTIELLLSKSFEMIEARTAKQETPLILAAHNGSMAIIKFLLTKKVDLEAKDCNGMNSLHWAAVKGRLKVVYLLLSHKADLEAKDNENKTALIFAAQNGHTDVIRLLLSSGARVTARDKNGLTALNWATNCNQVDAVTVLNSANRFTIEASGYFLICLTFIVLILSWLLLKFI